MKLLFDFFPIIAFFVTFKAFDDPQQGILYATGVVIVATGLQVGVTWAHKRKVETMHLVTLVLVVVLGGITIALKDEIFIKWKPTVVNWLFGVGFLATQFLGDRTLVERIMGANVSLPQPVWRRLNLSWVLFFAAVGVINVYVVYNFDTESWVNFKLFGMLGLTILFVLAQAVYMMRHTLPEESESGGGDA
jgi:intracellular septation protein